MHVDLALLADYATVTQEGKLIIAGVFDKIVSPSLPWTHPTMSLVFKVTVDAGEGTEHQVEVRGFDPDGDDFVPQFKGPMHVNEPDFLDGASASFRLNFNGLPLRKPGHHRFDIFIDGEYANSAVFKLEVRQSE